MFQNNTDGGGPDSNLGPFNSSAPSGIVVLTQRRNVSIDNEPFRLAFSPGFSDSSTAAVTNSTAAY
ncbi:MAG: hypothetical protein ACREC5_07810 [Thermoplasmata archaeon]